MSDFGKKLSKEEIEELLQAPVLAMDETDKSKRKDLRSLDNEDKLYREIISERLDFLENNGVNLFEVDTEKLVESLYKTLYDQISEINAMRDKGCKVNYPKHFSSTMVAYVMARVYHMVFINLLDRNLCKKEECALAIWDEKTGIYDTGIDKFGYLASRIEETVVISGNGKGPSLKTIESDLYKYPDLVPAVVLEQNPNLVPCENGIFDFKTKEFRNYTPNDIFLYKYNVRYNPFAQEPEQYTNDGKPWHFFDWLSDLFNDNEQDVNTIKHILVSSFLPRKTFENLILFYSYGGGSGKGNLLAFLEDIVGGQSTSFSMEDFGEKYALENLIGVPANFGHENNVDGFLDKLAKLKAVTSCDSVTIERKFKGSLQGRLHLTNIQCINKMPALKDGTKSMTERMLIVKFPKSFRGKTNVKKEIKDKLIHDAQMQEFVFNQLMQMEDFDTIPQSPNCCNVLEEIRRENNVVYRFYREIMCEENTNADGKIYTTMIPWYENKIPFRRIYPIFCGWYQNVVHGRNLRTDIRFKKELAEIIQADDDEKWKVVEKNLDVTTKNQINGLNDWLYYGREFLTMIRLLPDDDDEYFDRLTKEELSRSKQFNTTATRCKDYVERTDCSPVIVWRPDFEAGKQHKKYDWVDETGKYASIEGSYVSMSENPDENADKIISLLASGM